METTASSRSSSSSRDDHRASLKNAARCLLFLLVLGGAAVAPSVAFKFVPLNREVVYEYVGVVRVGAQAPMDTADSQPPPASGWQIRGTLKLQRRDNHTLAAALAVEKINLHNSRQTYYQNKEMLPVYNPFKITTDAEDCVHRLAFKRRDPPWSRNFKRAIAAAIQVQGTRAGTFVTPEPSIHGRCSTEYYIAADAPNRTLTVRKTSELNSCAPYPGGIHYERSNVPVNPCEFDYQKNVIVGNEASYVLDDMRQPDGSGAFQLRSVRVTGLTMVQTFESTGEAQYISSTLDLQRVSETDIVNALDVLAEMTDSVDAVQVRGPSAPPPPPPEELTMGELGRDGTGGRQTEPSEKLIKDATALFGALADSLEGSDLNFDEPYDNRVADIIQVMGQLDSASLRRLYADIEVGTSYRQETIRNLFYEIIPRIGTHASVVLTRDVILESKVRPWTAIQLLISLPFHVLELSEELVAECEKLLELGQNRPDVQEAAILSFATLVYHAYNRTAIEEGTFERYVTMYCDRFARGADYEGKMIYLQGLGNMLIGKVAEYVDPIIWDASMDTDTRFLAILATMPLVRSRPEQVYETYWPLFNDRNNTLELRVLAFSALLLSNPSPARLMSLHNVLRDEPNRHMQNFYRTTILSMSGTTHPCYQELKRLLSYMSRHIPQSEAAKYWATGQYLYDYRDQQYGIGAMLQNTLIADERTSIPYIGIFEFHTEALGKFSSQLTLIIKARGLFDGIARTVNFAEPHTLFPQIVETLSKLRLPSVQSKPFHLEVLVKSESKFVTSFYINQKSIQDLTKQHTVRRLFDMLMADSHINMQTIRWPFMLKYAVPTVLGTPAQVTIQSTVLASWRGNLTQADNLSARSHHLDGRYSSYAVCKSTTYNPFLNLEHTINREQGFLVYLPVQNEISKVDDTWRFSLERPANVTSAGASLKSRSLTSTKGTILPTDKSVYSEVLISDTSRKMPMSHFRHEMRDLGLNFTAGSTIMDLTNHIAFLVQSDIKENTKVLLGGNSVIDVFIMSAGILQLNAMHIGNNKNFAFLLHNERRIKMQAALQWPRDAVVRMSVVHTVEELEQLSWALTLDASNVTEIGFDLRVERFDAERHRTLSSSVRGSFEYLIYRRRPYALKGVAEFDTPTATTTAQSDGAAGAGAGAAGLMRSRIDVALTAGMSEYSLGQFAETTEALYGVDGARCPREMLLFNPPPTNERCRPALFANMSMLSKYTLDVQLENMPAWYNEYAHRAEHFVATFARNIDEPLNFSARVDVRVDVLPEDLMMRVRLNRDAFTVPNVPRYLRQLRDVKFDSLPAYALEYGLTTMCSVVGSSLYSFNDQHIDLATNATLPDRHDTAILLLSECGASSAPFAILMRRLPNGRYALRIRHKHADVEYSPETPALAAVVHVNGRAWPLADAAGAAAAAGARTPIDWHVNGEGLLALVVWPEYIVQFDMERPLFTVQRANVNKERLCGVCNEPLNGLESYVVEGLEPSFGAEAAGETTTTAPV